MKKKKKENAFTLIEIVAALAVLALGILSILSLFPLGQQSSEKSGKMSKATLLGQTKLEELTLESREGFSYDGLSGLKDAGDDGVFVTEDRFYEWEYDVVPPPSTNKLVFVTLGIYWPAGISGSKDVRRQRQKSIKFATYLSDYFF
ncbi:prepilin-type N-terminal cleavage/methylation domain-containing protein [Candidatus Auribacterota bacterium]